jgi:hypothetical protein
MEYKMKTDQELMGIKTFPFLVKIKEFSEFPNINHAIYGKYNKNENDKKSCDFYDTSSLIRFIFDKIEIKDIENALEYYYKKRNMKKNMFYNELRGYLIENSDSLKEYKNEKYTIILNFLNGKLKIRSNGNNFKPLIVNANKSQFVYLFQLLNKLDQPFFNQIKDSEMYDFIDNNFEFKKNTENKGTLYNQNTHPPETLIKFWKEIIKELYDKIIIIEENGRK